MFIYTCKFIVQLFKSFAPITVFKGKKTGKNNFKFRNKLKKTNQNKIWNLGKKKQAKWISIGL